MKKSGFYFELPEELIAQEPTRRRDGSRLLCLDKVSGEIGHRRFYDLPALLRDGDCLVLNDSRVMPARLIGRKITGATIEIVLLRELENGSWEALTKPGRKTAPGTRLEFGEGELTALVTGYAPGGNRIIKFEYEGNFLEVLEKLGRMPLPPYIKQEPEDGERYQTVYSRETGSAAAPTAGLHFTNELLDEIRTRGVKICFLTLHVGLGTFRPVKTVEIEQHEMHSEFCVITGETARIINETKKAGGRIVAVGTTSCRTLESFAGRNGFVCENSGFTNIFIYPGYEFKCVDALITNFHLPESTLIMLVSAMAGRENVLNAYKEAVKQRYRFFSFGDAMLIE